MQNLKYQATATVAPAPASSPANDRHLKSNHRMDRCWLQGQSGDALHAVICATGYNLCRLGLKALFMRPLLIALLASIVEKK